MRASTLYVPTYGAVFPRDAPGPTACPKWIAKKTRTCYGMPIYIYYLYGPDILYVKKIVISSIFFATRAKKIFKFYAQNQKI